MAGFTYTLNGGTLSTTNTSQNANAYVWDFGDGTTSTQVQPSHTYNSVGTFTITLIATNACGGADTTTQVLEVLGTSELFGAMFKVFPNPNNGTFTVEGLSSMLGQEVEILDVAGRRLLTQTLSESTIVLELPSATNGLYFVRVGKRLMPLSIQH
ncbi:MAG: PKD domain-containing protein [Synechococcaceae bacterium WB7_1C_051]|nr:PKD domain-containing protein [Synechococcaceae bacterium WB7_1C_051]